MSLCECAQVNGHCDRAAVVTTETLAVIDHGVGRGYRGRNGRRRLATGTGRARDAVRSRPARSAYKS
jgi:hypothetical protein